MEWWDCVTAVSTLMRARVPRRPSIDGTSGPHFSVSRVTPRHYNSTDAGSIGKSLYLALQRGTEDGGEATALGTRNGQQLPYHERGKVRVKSSPSGPSIPFVVFASSHNRM